MIEFLKRVFGTRNSREVRRLSRRVAGINALEPQMQALSDEALAAQTVDLREKVRAGASLDSVLEPAFAAVREAARRVLGLRLYDVQMVGGMALHEGRIAEMRTGEGKTLVATLPAYLNTLGAGAVHIVTVNDYLARRDADWMGPVYRALGLTVGVIQNGQRSAEKQAAYAADITYGTNNEFGFDYLRDNMAFTAGDRVQRGRDFAIIDEVDSILIDEARTPLIISGPAGESTDLYVKINRIVPRLTLQTLKEDDPDSAGVEGDYTVDEKNRHIELTERGHQRVEEAFIRDGLLDANDSLYGAANLSLLHHVHAALKAHVLYKRDVDYIVQNNEVVIVDEHTGRVMQGRRWSEGIHQAIEAKEGLPIQRETQTYASTTFQNYFRLYNKLAGMTGTADTEATEFRQIYNLDVLIVPTHRPMVRADHNDLIYLTLAEKVEAVLVDINDCRERGQPVLVGTASVEASEQLSAELTRRNVPHNVLNAKNHAREADVIAQAGRPGAVTIATNMAGRGTDIVLGGNLQAELAAVADTGPEQEAAIRADWESRHEAVLKAGGLHIIGTERHESRRIDNQLRGRSGRQGDAGSSRFYLSMEDNLLRIFASDAMRRFMGKLGMEKGEAIEAKMVTNAIERAQRKVEQHNFDIRKNLLEFDDVANDQRRIIYSQRNELMEASDISEMLQSIREDVFSDLISEFVPPNSLEEQWNLKGLEEALGNDFALQLPVAAWMEEDTKRTQVDLRRHVLERVEAEYEDKVQRAGPEIRGFEKQVMLQVLDQLWKEHLATMDYLRQGIHLRAYAQKQPKQEYKREAFELFQNLLGNIKRDVIRVLTRVRVQTEAEIAEAERKRREAAERAMQFSHPAVGAIGVPGQTGVDSNGAASPRPAAAAAPARAGAPTFRREVPKVGRNEPCPCGSGKKYKHCHGRTD